MALPPRAPECAYQEQNRKVGKQQFPQFSVEQAEERHKGVTSVPKRDRLRRGPQTLSCCSVTKTKYILACAS